MWHVGFSGTQRGMTPAQKSRFVELVAHRQMYFHHGDCVGSDAEADALVREHCRGLYGVIMHPSNLVEKRAFCKPRYPHDVVLDPRDPLDRDEDIVRETACLVAASKTEGPVLRSGTWTTIRLAVDAGKPVCVIYPSGALMFPTPGVGWLD